jgi:hypothetical protein
LLFLFWAKMLNDTRMQNSKVEVIFMVFGCLVRMFYQLFFSYKRLEDGSGQRPGTSVAVQTKMRDTTGLHSESLKSHVVSRISSIVCHFFSAEAPSFSFFFIS